MCAKEVDRAAGESNRVPDLSDTEEKEQSDLVQEMPAHVQTTVCSHLSPDESLWIVISTDMLSDGMFGQGWFVATDRRLLVYDEDSADGVLQIPLAEIRELDRRHLPGCFQLQARTPDRAVNLVWYSHDRFEPFDRAINALRPLIPEAAGKDESSAQPRKQAANQIGRGSSILRREGLVCESCGKPIPKRIGVCPDCLDKRRLLIRLLRRIKPYRVPVIFGLLLLLLLTAVEMSQPVLIKVLVDNVIPNQDLALFAWLIAGIVGIYAFSSLFTGLRSFLMAWFGQKVVYDLRNELYVHIQALSLEFFDRKGTGWVMDRVTSDTANLQDFLTEGLQDFLRDVMTVLVIITIMFIMDWTLALMTLLPAPLVIVLTVFVFRRTRRLWHAIWRKRARMASLLGDVIPGVRVVKAFNQEQGEIDRFDDRARDFMNTSVRAHRTFSVFHPAVSFITAMGFVMVWGYGGYRAIVGTVTLGTLIAFISYLWRFYGPLNNLSRLSLRLQRATTAAQRVFEVLDTRPSVRIADAPRHMPLIQGQITFDHVTFGYEPQTPVLEDLNFTVEPGEMIGLVGPSGAGKSTTINLLCRFYDVDQGSIAIDGIDIRDVTPGSLRSQMGVVLQETFLFHGTVAENIVYGSPDAQMPDIIGAAKAANAHDFIMRLPDAYDTLVAERGQRLSVGERQRIAIARAILKDPRILVLDEATASVDTETEAAIREALDRLIQGRTTIAIAHRFSTLRNADRLIVLEDGRVVEIGSHEELMAKEEGLFRRLCEMQSDLNRIVAVGG